jgi:arylamine N-acetyltransferase
VGLDVDRYLERIGHRASTTPDSATLASLQFAHMSTRAFENLDVHAWQSWPMASAGWSTSASATPP